MNLLLLLSALLSALTGAVSSGRAPTVAHAAVAAASIRAEVAGTARSIASRPLQPLPELRTVALSLVAVAASPAVPLYASRRRE